MHRSGGVVSTAVALRLTVALAIVATGLTVPVHGQGCPGLTGFEGFGPYNQTAAHIAVAGRYAYTADTFGLTVYDMADPKHPAQVGNLLLAEPAWAVAVSGEMAYVADGRTGLQVIDVSDPAQPIVLGSLGISGAAIASGVTVSSTTLYLADFTGLSVIDVSDPAAPVLLGSYTTPGRASSVAVADGVAYVLDYNLGLQIIDVGDATNPSLLGSYQTPGYVYDIMVSDGRAYVADASQGLLVIDVGNPAHPSLLGSSALGGGSSVALSGTVAYLGQESFGVQVINIANPAKPTVLGSHDTPGELRSMAVAGTKLYLADGESSGGQMSQDLESSLRVLDISDPADPTLLGSLETPGDAMDVAIAGGIAYVADGTAGLLLVDLSDPGHTTLLGRCNTPGRAAGVAVSGTYAYVADGLLVDDTGRHAYVAIVNVADPSKPVLTGTYDTPDQAFDVAVSGSTAYVAGGSSGLLVLDISDPAHPTLLGDVDTPGYAKGVAVAGSIVYVADSNSLQIADVSDPSNPRLVGTFAAKAANGVTVAGDTLYVADSGFGLQILDVSDPADPVSLSTWDIPDFVIGVTVSTEVAYVADRGSVFHDPAFHIVDVSDPAQPTLLSTVATRRPPAAVALDGATGTAWLAGGAILEGVTVQCAVCPNVAVTASPPAMTTGGATSTLTVTLTDEAGQPLPGKTVTATVPSGSVSAFTDRGDGSYTATFTSGDTPGWVEVHVSVDGAPCDTRAELHVTFAEDPPLAGPLPGNLAMIPGSAHVSGAEGTAWRSDAVLHNPGSREASAALFFLETGKDNSATLGEAVAVAPGSSLALNDLVSKTFGKATSGAILVASDEPLLITSRTYNDVPTGTFGQFVPGLALTKAVGAGEKARLIQLTRNQHFRTNIGFANATDEPLHVTVELYRADGTALASPAFTIPPWGFYQKTRIITTDVDDAYAVVSSADPGARYFTYASVVDNGSGDPTFVQPVPATDGIIVVPAAAHVKGAAGTNWKTDLEIHNPAANEASFSLAALLRDQPNPSPPTSRFAIPAGGSLRLVDVLDSVFNFSGAAALRITPSSCSLMVTSRTYNDVADGTYGQFIPGLPKLQGTDTALGARLVQLSQSSSGNQGFRTNLGLTNVKARTTEISIALYDGEGESLGAITQTLAAYEFVQLDKIFNRVTSEAVANGYAIVSSDTEGAAFFAYASVVDNRSGDPVNVPALR